MSIFWRENRETVFPMDNKLYSEIYNHLEHREYPSKFKRGSQARKNWGYRIRERYAIKTEELSTFVRKRLAITKVVSNILGTLQPQWLWVISENELPSLLAQLHESMGHAGRNLMMSTLTSTYWWPGMQKSVEAFLQKCTQCLQYKTSKIAPPLRPIVAQTLDERVCSIMHNWNLIEMATNGF
jgi:hypothetical protein